jgi:hypothetical protein
VLAHFFKQINERIIGRIVQRLFVDFEAALLVCDQC